MILFRAMNELDITIDPSKNGLASKKLIYDATKRYLYNTNRNTIEKLSTKEKDEYIKENMKKYILDHKYKIGKLFQKQHKPVRDIIHKYVEEKDDFAYFQIIRDLSTLPNHLINGSRTYTNWISTTNEFDGIWNYYDRQNIHEVAVLDVYTNGVFDENTYIVDLSNREVIDKIKFISNKIDDNKYESFIKYMKENPEYKNINTFHKFVMKPTDKKFMGFNFAAASSEYSIYEYLPKESIISILESLQIDLICANILNEDIFKLKPNQQKYELEKLKNMILKHIRKDNDSYMLYVFDELYLKKHNISEIVSNKTEEQKMIITRNNIISNSQFLPSKLIKRK